MKRKYISQAIGNISEKYVNEAAVYTGETKVVHRTGWMKWGAVAACLVLATVLGIGVFQGSLFSSKEQIATLDNGDKIYFIQSDAGMGNLDIAVPIETRDLTEGECEMLFHEMPVAAHAIFNAEYGSMIGLEGKLDDIRLIVSASNGMIRDTVIEGEENISEVDGVLVHAGYFTNNKNAIYYAAFRLGESTVYVEHAGAKEDGETIKNELSSIIQNLIALGDVDFSQILKELP